MGRRRGRLGVLVAAALFLAACDADSNFSQYPGFAEWYAAHPPSEQLPTAAEQALLARYRPRVFLPAGNEGPVDFYRDYVAEGQLFDGAGRLISAAVTPELLNASKRDPKAVFVHTPSGAAPRPVIYGRIDHADLDLPGCAGPLPVTFLTYNLVFRHSGLPAGLPDWQAIPLDLVADLDDWHQLDHYTALTLALAPNGKEDGKDLAPFAVTFQQHDYQRTYVLADRDGPGSLVLPPDGRLRIDVARRSNELYPHRPGRVQRRAVAFMSPKTARYLVEGLDAPWLAADDITEPVRRIRPELRFLPPADAFYVFQGRLGAHRLLPGRDGPPGADYNTLPAFKSKATQLALAYWTEDDQDYLARLGELFAGGRPHAEALAPFAARLARALQGSPALAACAGLATA